MNTKRNFSLSLSATVAALAVLLTVCAPAAHADLTGPKPPKTPAIACELSYLKHFVEVKASAIVAALC